MGLPSDHAGAVFLIALLQRLGFDELMQDERLAGSGLPFHILTRWCDRLRIPADDPVRAALSASGIGHDASGVWRLASGRAAEAALVERLLALAPRPIQESWSRRQRRCNETPDARRQTPDVFSQTPDAVLTFLARRLLWQQRLTLRRLVRKPGLVLATATHIDATFPLEDADIRVRLLGLDLDPGWVPWLGRVVGIHYSALDQP